MPACLRGAAGPTAGGFFFYLHCLFPRHRVAQMLQHAVDACRRAGRKQDIVQPVVQRFVFDWAEQDAVFLCKPAELPQVLAFDGQQLQFLAAAQQTCQTRRAMGLFLLFGQSHQERRKIFCAKPGQLHSLLRDHQAVPHQTLRRVTSRIHRASPPFAFSFLPAARLYGPVQAGPGYAPYPPRSVRTGVVPGA